MLYGVACFGCMGPILTFSVRMTADIGFTVRAPDAVLIHASLCLRGWDRRALHQSLRRRDARHGSHSYACQSRKAQAGPWWALLSCPRHEPCAARRTSLHTAEALADRRPDRHAAARGRACVALALALAPRRARRCAAPACALLEPRRYSRRCPPPSERGAAGPRTKPRAHPPPPPSARVVQADSRPVSRAGGET
eukprot:scaffold1811_cov411-Prasinococcus_capsulatus_cf.AAC.1